MQQEAVEDAVELVHGREVDLEDEAVLAGDAVALHDFGDAPRQVRDLGQPAGIGADAHVGGEGQSKRGRVEVEAVAPRDLRPTAVPAAGVGRRDRLPRPAASPPPNGDRRRRPRRLGRGCASGSVCHVFLAAMARPSPPPHG